MDLTEQEKIETDARREARREMLATVAAGAVEAAKELDAARAKAKAMKERRDRSVKAADEKIVAFKRDKVAPLARAARECEEARQALFAEFVPIGLVKARDRADEALGHARLGFRRHELDELETKRLLKIAKSKGQIDSKTAKEWHMKIKASARDRKRLAEELAKLTENALACENALAEARAAALAIGERK